MQLFFPNITDKKVQAIIIIPADRPGDKDTGKKFQYIDNSPHGISTFLSYAKRTFIKASHINFYTRPVKGSYKGNYIDRIYIN
jgi:hypothetical protein